jgi:hypothetical protein
VLGPGDSLNFDSTIPHRLSNRFNESVVGTWFLVNRRSQVMGVIRSLVLEPPQRFRFDNLREL